MPTYSYRCTECGTAFDIQQAFTDDSLTVCPHIINGTLCGGKLRKLFSAVGVSFSGSGFYRNDSRASETKAREKAESKSETKSDSATKVDAKPAPASPNSSAPAAKSSAPAKSAAPAKKE